MSNGPLTIRRYLSYLLNVIHFLQELLVYSSHCSHYTKN